MSEAKTLEDARKQSGKLISLVVNSDWTEDWQSVVGEFPNLEALTLRSDVDLDISQVKTWPKNLRRLSAVFKDPKVELPPFISALPHLRSLTVWGSHLQKGELPDEMGELQELEELKLKSCGLRELPASIAKLSSLRRLEMLGLPMKDFPAVICELEHLRELEFRQPFRELPDAFANLKNLRVLVLKGALNNTMSAYEIPQAQMHPLPAVIGTLPALEELDLSWCGIYDRDTDTLRGNQTLRSLNLHYAGITNLEFVKDLPALRQLLLANCYKIRNLKDLAGTLLEEISMESNHYLKSLDGINKIDNLRVLNIDGAAISSLEPVFNHPTLETLVTDNKAIQEKWASKDALVGITKESILAGLDSSDPVIVEKALRQFAAWIEQYGNGNLCYEFFDVEEDDGQVEVPILSKAISTEGISSEALAGVVKATFREMHDCLEPTVEATQLLIDRGDVEGQKVVATAFIEASKHYDGGHRAYEDTVQDCFLDELFPEFHPDALAVLLPQLQTDQLGHEYGDGMDELFAIALKDSSPETTQIVLDALKEYIEYCKEYDSASYIKEIVDPIAEINPAAWEELKDVIASIEEAGHWESQIEEAEDKVEILSKMVNAFENGELSAQIVKSLEDSLHNAIRKAEEIPASLAGRLVLMSFATDTRISDKWLLSLLRDDTAFFTQHSDYAKQLEQKIASLFKRLEDGPEKDLALTVWSKLSSTSKEDLRKAVVGDELLSVVRDYQRLEAALRDFIAFPSQVEFDFFATQCIARTYESLYHMKKWKQMSDISDLLLQARTHLKWSTEHQQYCLTYPLGAAVEVGGDFYDKHVAPWLEGVEIEEPRFAFNLACYQAKKGDDDQALFDAIKKAIDLGKPKQQFLEDDDFAAHLDKPAMKELCGG